MDHVVYLDAKANELENLIRGSKSMIIRGAEERKINYGSVKKEDILYLINNNCEEVVKARGIVSSVLYFENLSVEESFETIIRHQDKLQLPDEQFERWAGKPFLVLVDISDINEIDQFPVDKSNFTDSDDWIPVGRIEECIMYNMR